MPSLPYEWFDQLGKTLAAHWPIALGLALLVGVMIIWLILSRHQPQLTVKPLPIRESSVQSTPLPVLRGVSGEFRGSVIELDEEPLLIGRDPKLCQLVFPVQTQGISKRHCIIRFHPRSQCFLLVDCNSANGTFLIGGERLPNGGSLLLNAGQQFYLTDPQNLFEVNFEAPR